MDFTTINSLNSYISGLKMQGLWHLCQQNGASHQDEITVDGVTFHRRDETLASIRAKLDAGGSLTEEERAYLRQHDIRSCSRKNRSRRPMRGRCVPARPGRKRTACR